MTITETKAGFDESGPGGRVTGSGRSKAALDLEARDGLLGEFGELAVLGGAAVKADRVQPSLEVAYGLAPLAALEGRAF